ncbi:MAG: hypothetical protein ACOYKZ_04640 [Chlamydiia bacterium]
MSSSVSIPNATVFSYSQPVLDTSIKTQVLKQGADRLGKALAPFLPGLQNGETEAISRASQTVVVAIRSVLMANDRLMVDQLKAGYKALSELAIKGLLCDRHFQDGDSRLRDSMVRVAGRVAAAYGNEIKGLNQAEVQPAKWKAVVDQLSMLKVVVESRLAAKKDLNTPEEGLLELEIEAETLPFYPAREFDALVSTTLKPCGEVEGPRLEREYQSELRVGVVDLIQGDVVGDASQTEVRGRRRSLARESIHNGPPEFKNLTEAYVDGLEARIRACVGLSSADGSTTPQGRGSYCSVM